METQEFLTKVKELYLNEFPDSFISIEKSRSLYHSIFITCHLGNRGEWNNGIRHNDPLQVMLQIDLMTGEFPKDHNNTDSLMPDNLRLVFEHSHYKIKSDNAYKYCDSKKAGGRFTKGNPEKILNTLEKYFKGVKLSLKESLESGLIMDADQELIRAKIGV